MWCGVWAVVHGTIVGPSDGQHTRRFVRMAVVANFPVSENVMMIMILSVRWSSFDGMSRGPKCGLAVLGVIHSSLSGEDKKLRAIGVVLIEGWDGLTIV